MTAWIDLLFVFIAVCVVGVIMYQIVAGNDDDFWGGGGV